MKSAKKSSTKKKTKPSPKKAAPKGRVVKKVKTVKKAAKSLPAKKLTAKSSAKSVERVGIFGGTFDPFHAGHLNSLESVASKMRLKKIRVIPAAQSPLRQMLQGSSPEQRLEMARLGIQGHEKSFLLDDREIRRGGISYTIDTIEDLMSESPNEEIYLIMGMDQFENFDKWRDYQKIISLVNLVVTSRPPRELARDTQSFPEGVRLMVKKFSRQTADLITGKRIHFLQLEDLDVSGTDIRRRLRDGREVVGLMPKSVEEFVVAQKLYRRSSSSIVDFGSFTQQCADWLKSKGGLNIQGFDIREMNAPTEFTLVASGTSTRHTTALAEFISREVKTQLGVYPQGVEGLQEGRWVVLDYGSLIIHIFYDFVRQEYRLEELWSKGKPLNLVTLDRREPSATV